MWFLPMLFWCFVLGWPVMKYNIGNIYIWILLVGLALISYIPLPFRLATAFYYLPFFIGGGILYRFYSGVIKNSITLNRVVGLWILFLLLFVGLTICNDYLALLADNMSLLHKALVFSAMKATQIAYSAVGVMSLYCTAVWYTKNHNMNPHIIAFGKYCFGIYLFQQFMLQIIYYKTDIPAVAGAKWLPWAGLAITLIISTALSYMLSKTRTGRMLIG